MPHAGDEHGREGGQLTAPRRNTGIFISLAHRPSPTLRPVSSSCASFLLLCSAGPAESSAVLGPSPGLTNGDTPKLASLKWGLVLVRGVRGVKAWYGAPWLLAVGRRAR